MDRETLLNGLIEKTAEHGKRQLKTILSEYHLPERFVKELLTQADIPVDSTCAHLSKKARNTLIGYLTAYPFGVKSCGGFNEAMVTAGGVSPSRTLGRRQWNRNLCPASISLARYSISTATPGAITSRPHSRPDLRRRNISVVVPALPPVSFHPAHPGQILRVQSGRVNKPIISPFLVSSGKPSPGRSRSFSPRRP